MGIKLPMYKKADARKKPENFAGHSRSGRKWGLKNHACDLVVGCQVGCDGGAERLTERNDHSAVDAFCVHEVFVGRFGIVIDPGFARFSFAAAITPVFQGKDVCGCAAEKFVDGCSVGHVGGVAVKGEKCEFRAVMRNPPRV